MEISRPRQPQLPPPAVLGKNFGLISTRQGRCWPARNPKLLMTGATTVWAFDLGKGSLGEAVRNGNEFLHKASLLIPAYFAETKTADARPPSGCHIAAELVHELDADGKQLRVVKLADYTVPRSRERERVVADRVRVVGRKTFHSAEKVRTLCASPDELRARWADAGQRCFSLSASTASPRPKDIREAGRYSK